MKLYATVLGMGIVLCVVTSAHADDDKLSPAQQACLQGCVNQSQTCQAGMRGGGNVQAQAQVCANQVKACVMGCSAMGAGGGGGAAVPASNGTGESDYNDLSAGDNSQQQIDQLVQAWQQGDASRSTQAEQVARQAIEQAIAALCQSHALDGACALGGRPSALGPPRSFAPGHRTDQRWAKQAAASSTPSACVPGSRSTTATLHGGKPGAFIKAQFIGLCVPGAPCSGDTSVTVDGMSFDMSATTLPPSGMCVMESDNQQFQITLHAHNNTSLPISLQVDGPTIQTSIVVGWALDNTTNADGWSLANMVAQIPLIPPGATQDVLVLLDCARPGTQVWAGKFRVIPVPVDASQQLRIDISSKPTCKPPVPASSITATAGVSIPVSGGTFTEIQ